MTTLQRSRLLAGALAVAVFTSCEPPTQPRRGTSSYSLNATPVLLAGLLVEVTGEGIGTVSSGGKTIDELESSLARRVVLIRGSLSQGTAVIEVQYNDDRKKPTIRVLQAARDASHGFAAVDPTAVSLK